MIKMLCCVFLATSIQAKLETLDDAIHFASNTPEYDQYVEKIIIKNTLTDVIEGALKKKQPFDYSFMNRIEKLITLYKNDGYFGYYALVMDLKKDSKLYIVSNVQGNIHSLTRILKDLKNKNVISNNLKITNGNFIIFNGNIIGDSYYDDELLDLLSLILERNRDRAFYIRGYNEDKEHWLDLPLGKQMEILFPGTDRVRTLIRNFLNTLPIGFYVMKPQEAPIRFASFGIQHNPIRTLECKQLHKSSTSLCTINSFCAPNEGPVSAYIVSNDTTIKWHTMNGLQLRLNPTTWTIISSPAYLYKQRYGFVYDAYCMLTIAHTLHDSTLTLFNHILGKDISFAKSGTFNSISGNRLR